MKTAEQIIEPFVFVDDNTEDELLIKEKAIEAMKIYANQSKWIKSEYKLPEIGERVLCITDLGTQIGYRNGSGWNILGYNAQNIYHWQPLPKAPEK